MDKRKMAFVQRLEQNSKNYHPRALFDLKAAGAFLDELKRQYGLCTLMTDRHGAIIMTYGDFGDFKPDVVNAPGTKIRVKGRTVCHIYARYDDVADKDKETAKVLLGLFIKTLEGYSEMSYLASEQALYISELEQQLEKEISKTGDQKDPLTGVLNRNTFWSHVKQVGDREIIPTAAICVNINDWRFFDNNYGEEESDRLIETVAKILQDTVKEVPGCDGALIGRNEGDVFYVVIPYADMPEAKEFAQRVQEKCNSFEDPILAPSVAVGCVIKTNVEQKFKNLFSDAEYEMFENKFEIKNAPGYRERLEKGLK